MMKLTAAALLFLALLQACVANVPPSERRPATLAIVGGTIVDPALTSKNRKGTVLIADGKIVAIGPHLPVPRGAKVIIAAGRYVFPGLWDMHAHLAADTPIGEAPERYVGFGVLGIRDMGGNMGELLALRAEIDSGSRIGPRMIMAGPTLNGEKPAAFHRLVANAEEARTAVRELKAAGVDFIKIHRRTSREAFFAIADETRKVGLRFSGHVPLELNWIEAARAGMQTIEHVQTLVENEVVKGENAVQTGYLSLERVEGSRGNEIFEALVRNGTAFDPTLIAYEVSWQKDDPKRRALKQQFYERLKPLAGRAARAGVTILAGTDVLADHGNALLLELERLVAGGLTPRQALTAATTNPRQIAGKGPGRIAPGEEASLLILDEDPTVNVTNLRSLRTVVLRGRVIEQAELRRLRH